MTLTPAHKVWWTPAEIAEASLPDLPQSKRGVLKVAERKNWRDHEGAVRRRSGRGGGLEFHFMVFPPRARDYLAAQGASKFVEPTEQKAAADWSAYEALTTAAKAKAKMRLEAVQAAFAIERGGATMSYAVSSVAGRHQVSARSVWGWIDKVRSAPPSDWLPILAGKHRTAARALSTAKFDDEAWAFYKAEYLRNEYPNISDCYANTKAAAAKYGWALPSEKTVTRIMNKRIPRATRVYARHGMTGLKSLFPPQERDKSMLYATSAMDADFHKFDVFVWWNVDDEAPIRPQMSAFHDIYSGNLLAWRLSPTPNAATVLLTFGDAVRDYGIPNDVVFDNGREYAAKWITGGVPHRFRGKVKADDPLGVMPLMGIDVHFTTPYSGQSKPIERAFRDMCSSISKDPRFAGAYVGNRVDAKPENYGSKAISRDEFTRVLAERIAEFNARPGRRSKICNGRSFDETFVTSYKEAPIRKATPEQSRLWLLGAEKLRANNQSGGMSFMGNQYWSDWCPEIAGHQVVGRFDPEDLWAGLHVYATDGRYLGHAGCLEPIGFFDVEGGKARQRDVRRFRKAQKDLLEAELVLSRDEHIALIEGAATPVADLDLNTKIVRPDFNRKDVADVMAPPPVAAPSPMSDVEAAHHADTVVELTRAATPLTEETDRDRYRRARNLIDRVNAGERIGEAEAEWLRRYRTTPEFRANEGLYEDFGDDMFG